MADVLSRNVFALLDPDENTQLNEGAKQQTSVNKKEADKNKSKAVDTKKPADKTRAARGETRVRNEYPKRGGFRGVNGTSTDAATTGYGGQSSERTSRGAFHGEKRGRGGRGAGRGGRGREFDRRSGDDRFDGEKKEVAGKGTWGDPTDVENEAANVETPEETEAGETPATEVKAPEEEEKIMTLDAYLAEKAAKSLKTDDSVRVRKANEGTSGDPFKGAVLLEKKDDEDFFVGKEPSAKQKKAASKTKPVKTHLEIEQRFTDESSSRANRGGNRGREGGDRGNRGGNRGREGGDRGNRGGASRGSGSSAPRGRGGRGGGRVNVDDINAFPSLGGK